MKRKGYLLILAALILCSAFARDLTAQSTLFRAQSAKAGNRLTLDPTSGQVTTAVTAFTFPDNGGFSASTAATATSTTSGYARIQPGAGGTAPAGLAIFGFTSGGVIVSEAGVPASPLIESGRIYAEVAGAVNTGLAIANPNSGPATVTFNFTDSTGTDFGSGTTTIAAGGQIAKFLNQDPFNSGDNVNGTFTFTSDVPISVVALRGMSNERGDFLITTLPVAALATTSTATGFFPHFADGGGWTTQVILVNPTDGTLTGNVQFFTQGSDTASGTAATVTVDGVAASSFAYSIPGRSSRRFLTSGSPTATTSGSARIVPDGGSTTPSGLGVFSFKPGQFTVAEAGVPLLEPATAVRMYAESAPPIQTGVAVANQSSSPATVTFELTTLAGVSTGLTGTATIPGDGQIAKFLDQISGFEALTTPFQGVLRITTTSTSGVSIVGLRSRTNSRGDFLITTTSPVDENAGASTSEQLFPHFADGGGWSTQFILFGGSGTSTSGDLAFFSQGGDSIDVISVTLTLDSLSPTTIARSGTLTLNGTGFDSTGANNTVVFTTAGGTTNLAADTATATTLTVTVPGTAISGPVLVQSGGASSTSQILAITVSSTELVQSSVTVAAGQTTTGVDIYVPAPAGILNFTAIGAGDRFSGISFASSSVELTRGRVTDLIIAGTGISQANGSTLTVSGGGLLFANISFTGNNMFVAVSVSATAALGPRTVSVTNSNLDTSVLSGGIIIK